MIRDHDKLLLTYDGQPGKMKYPPMSGEPQLYDLQKDPEEKLNLAGEQSKLVSELTQLLNDWYVPKQRQSGKFIVADPGTKK